jgi:fructokinase
MGHISVARQPGDDFPGDCRFHGDCLEGMAGGTAIAARWGRPAEQLDGDGLREAVALQAAYLAAGLRDIVYTIAPQRIVIGGSVTALPGLFPLVRSNLAQTMAGFHRLPEHGADGFIVPAALGPLAGPAGALVLADYATQPRAR